MSDRIVDLAEEPSRLSVRLANLLIEREGKPEVTIPLAEIAVLVVSHMHVRYSHAVIAGLAQSGGAFVGCNEKHLPVAMLLPLDSNFIQAERFRAQASASLPLQKQAWRRIVMAKVRAQARLLTKLRGEDSGLGQLATQVRSGDPENVEAQASRRYWPAVFGAPDFRRDREAEDVNRHLNYGYAVLRALVARAICAAGLHPSLGLHHQNRYNAFCLADDLMEPFRAMVDEVVAGIVAESGLHAPMDGPTKQRLLSVLLQRFVVDSEARTLFDILARFAQHVTSLYLGEAEELEVPEPLPCAA